MRSVGDFDYWKTELGETLVVPLRLPFISLAVGRLHALLGVSDLGICSLIGTSLRCRL